MHLYMQKTILLSILINSLPANAETIDTASSGQFKNMPIHCAQNDTCTVICDANNGCQNAYIQCPRDHPCYIQCVANSACHNATFECPINNACDITCDQANACESAIINATYSSSLNLRECREGYYVCTGITIYFPPYDFINNSTRANITGDNSLSAGDAPTPLQFYAVNGWKDVNVVNYVGNYQYHQGTMHCGNHFQSECEFANDAFKCADDENVCQYGQSSMSDSPTMEPTLDPTLSPSAPTLEPTYYPIATQTTAQCVPDINLRTQWSNSYRNIYIYMENSNTASIIDMNSLVNDCRYIFDDNTWNLLHNESVCNWIVLDEHNINMQIQLKIDLSSLSSVDILSPIVITMASVKYKCNFNDVVYEYELYEYITYISAPMNAYKPDIIISSLPSQIGICDDLILDARSTTNLGGRDNAIFNWTFSPIIEGNPFFTGKYIQIVGDELHKGTTYNIQLAVTNWYGGISIKSFDIYVSSLAIPMVSLHGISEYSLNNLNLNGMVHIYADIQFDNECIDAINADLDYTINWTVNVTKIYKNDVPNINTQILTDLRQFIVSENSVSRVTELRIDASKYMQNGLIYTFTMYLHCVSPYECPIITAIHQVTYDYNDIYCDIIPNDISLFDVDPFDLQSLQLQLNGGILTYDTNNRANSDHLQWNWHCIDMLHNNPCPHLINNAYASITSVDLGLIAFNYSQSYSFRFVMQVNDVSNLYRDNCTDSISIRVQTKNQSDISPNAQKLFVVTAIALRAEINVCDRLRLLGDILNYKHNELTGYMEYKWHEVNGMLSEQDIEQYKQSSDSSANLILKECVLTAGKQYSFQLEISQYFDENKQQLIGYGISCIVSVEILQPPQIAPNSLVSEPQCNIQYASIDILLSTSYSLSLSADGDYTPLLYQFGYDNTSYFHSALLYTANIHNIYLPLGDFIIFADVMDAKSAKSCAYLQCSITLANYDICIPFKTDIIDTFVNNPTLTIYTKYEYIYQQINNYLMYLIRYDGEPQCVTDSIVDIVQVLTAYNVMSILCQSSYPITFSQTLISLMNLISSKKKLVEKFYLKSSSFAQIKEILFAILDPCQYIWHHMEYIDDFKLSADSIVTKIAKIYYENEDITNNISPIIIKPQYHHLLYSLTLSMIDLFKYLSNDEYVDLRNLLSASLYISQLIRVSLAIPGENTLAEFDGFSLYSVRVNNEDINVSVSDINVFISNEITQRSDNNLFDAVDILIVGINTSSNNVSTMISEPDANCDSVQGELSQNSISITIIGNNTNTSDLASNIDFTFECDVDLGCDDRFECVWYNEADDIWQNDGCFTLINHKQNKIQCSCSHLTTFATIHNLHSVGCNNKYLSEWLLSKEWCYINWTAASMFFMIFLYAVHEIYPFLRYSKYKLEWKQKSVFAMMSLGSTALLYSVACMLSSVVYMNNMIKLYVLLLLFPQITLFALFSIIFYTWFILAHGFKKNIHTLKKRVRLWLLALNIFIWFVLITYYILVLFEPNDTIFICGAYIWSVLLTIITLIVCIYSILVGKVLRLTAKISAQQPFGNDDWVVVRRLLIINSFITLYFVFQSFITIYLAVNPLKQTLAFTSIHLCVDIVNLCFICWMYRASMNRETADIDPPVSPSFATNKSRPMWSKFFEPSMFSKTTASKFGGRKRALPNTVNVTTPRSVITVHTEDDGNVKSPYDMIDTAPGFTRLKSKSSFSTANSATKQSNTHRETITTVTKLKSIEENKEESDINISYEFDDEDEQIEIVYDDDEFNNVLSKRHSITSVRSERDSINTAVTDFDTGELELQDVNTANPFGTELDFIKMTPVQSNKSNTSKHGAYDTLHSESAVHGQFTPNTLKIIDMMAVNELSNRFAVVAAGMDNERILMADIKEEEYDEEEKCDKPQLKPDYNNIGKMSNVTNTISRDEEKNLNELMNMDSNDVDIDIGNVYNLTVRNDDNQNFNVSLDYESPEMNDLEVILGLDPHDSTKL